MKRISILVVFALTVGCIMACSGEETVILEKPDVNTATYEEVQEYLVAQNLIYQESVQNTGDVSIEVREDTAENGQEPYAVIVTCSDSRVAAEHLFNAGLGELFVIRNAGNVIGDYDLGSIEYGVEHLGCKLVVILGHESCGAVAATIEGHAESYMATFVDEIASAIGDEEDAETAEYLNIQNSIDECMKSEILSEAVASGEVAIVGAYYSIDDGVVTFIE